MTVSRFAQFVREWRERRGLSQEDLQKELRIARVQYVHKLETGKVKRPSPDFLRRFASLAGKPIDELRMMVGDVGATGSDFADEDDRAAERYQVAFGHVIWAAPFVLAAMRAELSDRFLFSSFAHAPNAQDDGDGHLHDIFASSLDSGLTELRDRLIPAARGTLGLCPVQGTRNIETLSAREVRQLLRRQKVHVIAAPGELIAKQRSFVRIATIMDSSMGCVLLHRCEWPRSMHAGEEHGEIYSAKTEEIARCFREARQPFVEGGPSSIPFSDAEQKLLNETNGDALCFAAEDETVAAVYADEIEECVYNGKRPTGVPDLRVNIETGFVHEWTLEQLCSEFLEKRGRVLLGVVGWEPQTHWLRRQESDWKRTLLQRSPRGRRRPEHLTFDIAVPATADWEPEFRRAVDDLLTEIWTCVEEIALIHEPTADRQTIWWLARYFGYTSAATPAQMKDDEARELVDAISETRYYVGFDPMNYRKIAVDRWGAR